MPEAFKPVVQDHDSATFYEQRGALHHRTLTEPLLLLPSFLSEILHAVESKACAELSSGRMVKREGRSGLHKRGRAVFCDIGGPSASSHMRLLVS